MRNLATVLMAMTCVAAAGAARADDTMRCGSEIIMIGAKQSVVLQNCGEPASKSVEDVAKRDGRYYDSTTTVERWTYTSGNVQTVLTFDAGVLVEMETK